MSDKHVSTFLFMALIICVWLHFGGVIGVAGLQKDLRSNQYSFLNNKKIMIKRQENKFLKLSFGLKDFHGKGNGDDGGCDTKPCDPSEGIDDYYCESEGCGVCDPDPEGSKRCTNFPVTDNCLEEECSPGFNDCETVRCGDCDPGTSKCTLPPEAPPADANNTPTPPENCGEMECIPGYADCEEYDCGDCDPQSNFCTDPPEPEPELTVEATTSSS